MMKKATNSGEKTPRDASPKAISELRLLLDPDGYGDILGISIKDKIFGPLTSGFGGNEAQRKAYDRARSSEGMTARAIDMLAAHLESRSGNRPPDPSEMPSEVADLGSWAFVAAPEFHARAPKTFEALRKVVVASNSLKSTASTESVAGFAAGLRKATGSPAAVLFHDCAHRVEGCNSGEFRHAMAPIHVFFAVFFVFHHLLETEEDNNKAQSKLIRLYGEPNQGGPRRALGRWMDTAQSALGYQTKTLFYRALSNELDPSLHPQHAENSRIEWTKVASGKSAPPFLGSGPINLLDPA